MARKMKGRKGPEITKVEQKDKALTSVQFKLLDIARRMLFVSESLEADQTKVDPDLLNACNDSLRLLGHAFASLTARRRENILKFTNPSFESLLKDEERLTLDETSDLFGSSFLHRVVKNAEHDAKLRGVVHASGSGHRHSIHPGFSSSSNQRGHREGLQSLSSFYPGFNKRGSSSNFQGKKNVKSMIPFLADPSLIGGRVRFFAIFRPTLTMIN